MDIRQAYLAMVKNFPGGWDAIAPALGFTRSSLENRVYERKGQSVLVETALQMQKFTGTTHFAQAVANESGGVFIETPSFHGVADVELLKAYTTIVMDEGKFAHDFQHALDSNKFTRKEYSMLKADICKQQAHEMELLARIESLIEDETK